MDDKELKIKLMNYSIKYIMNNGSLKGIEDSLLKGGLINETTKEDKEEDKEKEVEEIIIKEEPKEEEDNPSELYDELKKTGMYTKEALPHVASEFGSNITETIENPFKDGMKETEEEIVEEPPKVDYTEILSEIKHSGIIKPDIDDISKEEKNDEDTKEKLETPKIKETRTNNPWANIKTVSPGEIEL